MSNPYYNGGSFPSTGSPATSASMRAELAAISSGFDKLPTLAGNGYKLIRVSASGTELEASTALPEVSTEDATFLIQNQADTTKQFRFSASGISTGQTRVLTVPDVDLTIVGLATTQTLTNKTLTTPVLSGTASGTAAGSLGYLSGALSYGTGSVQRTVVNTDEAQTLTSKTLTTPILSATAAGTTAGQLGYSAGVFTFGNGSATRTITTLEDAQTVSGAKTFSAANIFGNATGQTFLASTTTTQDGVVIAGRAGGATSLRVTLQPGTLTASRTITLGDVTGTAVITGANTIFVPAIAMVTRLTNGAASGTLETTTNKVMIRTLDYDPATDEYAQFSVRMPKGWDEGTVTAFFLWSNASGTGSVVWGIQGLARSDDDVLDTAFGTAQTVTDAVTAAGDLMQSAQTSAITIGGTPAENDMVIFQVYRNASSGSDTLASDARLHGVAIIYSTNAPNDA